MAGYVEKVAENRYRERFGRYYEEFEPGDIYERFGGVQGAAYLVGGVSVQVQKHGHVTLAVIRSGVGLRLGANVGYMKYTRSPTWNPL